MGPRVVLAGVLAAVLFAATTAVASPQYVITELGTLGGTESYAFSLNNKGQVVGKSYASGDGTYRAFTYLPGGGIQDLGTFGGTSSVASSISDSGQVVVSTWDASGMYRGAFIVTPGSGVLDLGSVVDTPNQGIAINNAGQVVGASYFDGGATAHAFLYTPTVGVIDLGTLGGSWSVGTAINNDGDVVGGADTMDGIRRAFYWSTEGGLIAIPTFGGESLALGINDRQQVVGYSYTDSGALHAFLYTPDAGTVDLDAQGRSQANAINGRGDVVGTTLSGAFLYTTADGMLDLNLLLAANSGWDLTSATDINDRGQIVGYGDFNGQMRAFLLTPNVVPEPGTLTLLGLGLAGLAFTRRWTAVKTLVRKS